MFPQVLMVAAIVLLTGMGQPAKAAAVTETAPLFEQADAAGAVMPEYFVIASPENTRFIVSWDANKVPAEFRQAGRHLLLDLEGGDGIERLYYVYYNNDLLLAYQVLMNDAMVTVISRFEGKTLNKLWSARVMTINLAAPAVRHGFAYITALGFIGKLDLKTGQFAWQNDKLGDGYSFESFDPPRFEGSNVIFPEPYDETFTLSMPVENRRPPKEIVVDDASGKIVKIMPLAPVVKSEQARKPGLISRINSFIARLWGK